MKQLSVEFKLISQTEYSFNQFLVFLPYILMILGILVTTGGLVKHRKNKLKRYWAEGATTLDDLIKTTYIMIIHKDVGISIFDRQISLANIDPDLISGFLQAISAFRSEIKMGPDDIVKDQGFEMDYYDFKIVITDGDNIRVALILNGVPSQKLKENQRLFTEKFEKRFEKDLKDFDGDITPYKKTEDLITS